MSESDEVVIFAGLDKARSGLATMWHHRDDGGKSMAISELRHWRRHLVDLLDIGADPTFLRSPFAKPATVGTIYVERGDNVLG